MSETTAKGSIAVPPLGRAQSRTLDDLYRQYWTDLCKQLKRQFGPGPPEPEDVAQAAFAKYAALDDPTQINDPRSFLFITARNMVLDHKRRNKLVSAYIDDALYRAHGTSLEEMSPERVLIDRERLKLFGEAIKGLPHKQRVVLTLKRLHGDTFEDIARKTGWSAGDISRQLKMALETVKEILDDPRRLKRRRDAAGRER